MFMLLMVENRIHMYAKANNKYMKNYNKDIESSSLMSLDGNYLYGWKMSQKFRVNGFKWKDKDFIKNYNENSDKGYILEVDVEYPKSLLNLHSKKSSIFSWKKEN